MKVKTVLISDDVKLDPRSAAKMRKLIATYMKQQNFSSVEQLANQFNQSLPADRMDLHYTLANFYFWRTGRSKPRKEKMELISLVADGWVKEFAADMVKLLSKGM